ncbi:MAG: RNA polymerase factor sigma-54 [Rhodobacteraceae bacterium]|nr:RNA polymerase factor sigma-54 [Paracoccaceae bacterium]
MAISLHLGMQQTQRLSMTPQLRQAIEILQLNQIDLKKYIEDEVEKNPLLELVNRNAETVYSKAEFSAPTGIAKNDFDLIDLIRADSSLLDHLSDQIFLMTAADDVQKIALSLIGELDDNGYLDAPVFELADRLSVKTKDIELALKLVQACEPTGIGARNLKECLKLQLLENNRFDPVIEKVLDNLPLIAKNDMAGLAEIIGEELPETAEILAEIRRLNPRPASDFTLSPISEIRPDISVKRGDFGVMRVELVSSSLPKILINHEYAAEITAQGGDAQLFARDCSQSAHWLIKALDQRAQTILKAATAIIQHQHAFFEQGPSAMLPLTLREIADSIDVHESTVSRVTNGKYLICDRGTFELKHFFVSKIRSIDRKSEFSSMEIRLRIKSLIDEENHKKTLSDDRIVNILREDGVDIARRTIAKYREAMSIPSSVQRRKIYLAN